LDLSNEQNPLSWQKKAAQVSLRGFVFIDAGAKA
jgi:hypothetical protein